jgi:hypothetical protein
MFCMSVKSNRSNHLTNRNGSPLLRPIENIIFAGRRPRDHADHYTDYAGPGEESLSCRLRCISHTHTNFFANHQHYASLISPLKERLNYTTYRHSSSQSIYLGLKPELHLVGRSFLLNPQCHHRARVPAWPGRACAPTISTTTPSQPHLTVRGGGICAKSKSVANFSFRLTFAPTALPHHHHSSSSFWEKLYH